MLLLHYVIFSNVHLFQLLSSWKPIIIWQSIEMTFHGSGYKMLTVVRFFKSCYDFCLFLSCLPREKLHNQSYLHIYIFLTIYSVFQIFQEDVTIYSLPLMCVLSYHNHFQTASFSDRKHVWLYTCIFKMKSVNIKLVWTAGVHTSHQFS